MELIKNQFYEKDYAIECEDPYTLALEFVNFVTSFGHVNVTMNKISNNGPRKQAEVHFYLERKFDRYSKLFFLFKMHADITMKRLEMSALGLNQIQIPVGGEVGDVFQEWYMKEIQPTIRKKSTKIIKEITKQIEMYIESLSESVEK